MYLVYCIHNNIIDALVQKTHKSDSYVYCIHITILTKLKENEESEYDEPRKSVSLSKIVTGARRIHDTALENFW